MHRRTLIKTGSLAVLGLAAGACGARAPRPARAAARRPAPFLPPVRVAWDRVIRTTVGLRPFRPGGFVLRAERFGDKTLIHNYGHGGAGWSLSWGTGAMAADMALDSGHRTAAVVGCGILGITAARQLQRRGFAVTLYAASVPPETTSNMALAGFTPTSGLVDFADRTPEWEAQFREAVQIAYREWQLLASPRWGVSWIENYTPTEDARAATGSNVLLPASVELPRELLGPGEHPFPTTYAVRGQEMRFEPSIALPALLDDVLRFGGRVVIRRFDTADDLARLTEPVVVNCTGLGSRELFGDTTLTPLKGQLIALIPQPEVEYATFGGIGTPRGGPGGFLHMMPRQDGIILGGTSERDVWSLDVNEEAQKYVIERHIELYASMRQPGGRA